MKFIAKTDGFIGGARIRKGQVFDYEGKAGKWMEPVKQEAESIKDSKPTKIVKDSKDPQTFSEMAKADGKAQEPKGSK